MRVGLTATCLATLGVVYSAVGSEAATASWLVSDGGNGHTYEIVLGSVSWATARDNAAASTFNGVNGYLATITSAEEQAFLDALFMPRTINTIGDNPPIDFSGLWLGGSDSEEEGVWRWVTGPESGQLISDSYENWAAGEPNDFQGEDYLIGWYRADLGSLWNDLPIDVGTEAVGYVIEYDTAVIPLPAGVWMLLSGLGALAVARRKRG